MSGSFYRPNHNEKEADTTEKGASNGGLHYVDVTQDQTKRTRLDGNKRPIITYLEYSSHSRCSVRVTLGQAELSQTAVMTLQSC